MEEDVRIALQKYHDRITALENHKEYSDRDDSKRDKLLNDIMTIVTAIKTKQDTDDGKKDGASMIIKGIWSIVIVVIISVSAMLYNFNADLAVIKNTIGIK